MANGVTNALAPCQLAEPIETAETCEEDRAIADAQFLFAIADPTRLRILRLLQQHEGTLCVSQLVKKIGLAQPTLSHHLCILRTAGLVRSHKDGLWAYYYIRREPLMRVYEIIDELL